ncbi:hypothetical protein [Amycolatopsis sp. RTGN1]|uniref:hypothetical protein n=1 Tax=Amycolatopsis ponsaeliensis TaxID=2992142 RepID=UPI00254F1498|nr:hypothetical protein [Amycolatopsis sp. RTGN1]
MKRRIFAAAVACAATFAGLLGTAGAAQAATSVTFTPRTVTSPHDQQYVAALGSVQLSMTATQTAYVYSTLRANNASNTTLIDNEVRCSSTSGWTKNEVLGQNVIIASATGTPASLRDISVTTRFLVHPGAAGTVTCTTYLRSANLGLGNSTVNLASGELKFADTSVANTTAGTPPQADDGDTPPGRVLGLGSAAPTVREPASDVFEMAPVTGLSVFGDMELMACYPEPKDGCPLNSMTARVTLFVNQWKADGTLCKSDASSSVTALVRRDVHHYVVPLNTRFTAATGNGCVPKFNFYVKTDWVSGSTGAVQMASGALPDATGSTATHYDAMSHAFAVAY